LGILLAGGYTYFLSGLISETELSRVIFVLILSEVFGLMVRTFPSFSAHKRQAVPDPSRVGLTEQGLVFCGLFCWFGMIVFLLTVAPTAILKDSPFAVFALVTLTFTIASTHSIINRIGQLGKSPKPLTVSIIVRLFAGAVLNVSASFYWTMSGDSVLALHLFAGLLWSAHCLTRDASARNNRSGSCAAALPQPENTWRINTLLGRYGDFIVIGWLLPPFEILVYCLARAISLSAECVSITLLQRVDQTSSLFDASKSSQQFLRAAARVNLGLFLVGCGSMVTVVVIAPLPARLILGDTMTLMSVLPWVLLAFSVPTICGATSLFLGKSQMYLADNLLQWTSTATGMILPALIAVQSAEHFAFLFAVSRLSIGVLGAVYVAWKLRILPGFTAVFYPQLRMI
jgi:hypothetical protein